MSLKRFVKTTLWDNFAATAGATTAAYDVSKVEFIGIFVQVSAATDITLEVETIRGWITYDTSSFTAAGEQWWNMRSFPFGNIRFKTSAAATITVEIFIKT